MFKLNFNCRVFGESNSTDHNPEEPLFSKAIETLQQLKTTFTPLEKLKVVLNTVKQVEQVTLFFLLHGISIISLNVFYKFN